MLIFQIGVSPSPYHICPSPLPLYEAATVEKIYFHFAETVYGIKRKRPSNALIVQGEIHKQPTATSKAFTLAVAVHDWTQVQFTLHSKFASH